MSENTYKAAGVDLVVGEEATKRIAKLAKATFTPNVVREVGLFGGFFHQMSEHPQYEITDTIDTLRQGGVLCK